MTESILVGKSEVPVFIQPRMANRHGLVAGATGTGKTVTLQRLAESFSRIGVPVFLADVKGDLAGISRAGGDNEKVAERVARYTGLSTEFVERNDLRLVLWRFLKELLRDEGKTVGRLDSRFTGHDRDSGGEFPEYDPSMEAVGLGYVTLMNDYIRRELGFETDLVYRPLAYEVFPWKWEGQENQFVNVAEDLRRAMVRNPFLHVLFASGYYDFATPYFDTVYTVNHLGLPEELRDHVSIAFYEAGHMMYIRKADHAKLKRDVAAFIEEAAAAP